jgi:hypothetical protein
MVDDCHAMPGPFGRAGKLRRAVLAWLAPLGLASAGAFALGCSPHIGDKCAVNSDCSLQGNLQCDTSQPNGYCTFFNCTSNSCQNNAACVAVSANVPGCPYDDYMSPGRTAVNMCLASCGKDSDCRSGEGYVCADPCDAPWNAQIVDNNGGKKCGGVHVCLLNPPFSVADGGEADSGTDSGAINICSAAGPLLDGSVFPTSSGPDGSANGGDAGAIDGGADTGGGASDAGAPDAADAAGSG